MATSFLLPLQSVPTRTLVRLGGVDYNIQTQWNGSVGCWVLDLYDIGHNLIVGGIALVTGSDLMEQFGYLELNMHLYVINTHGDASPGPNDLGLTCFLYYVPDAV